MPTSRCSPSPDLDRVVGQLRDGPFADLLKRIGFKGAWPGQREVPRIPARISELDSDMLGDLHATFHSELHRLYENLGLLRAAHRWLVRKSELVQAEASQKVRAGHSGRLTNEQTRNLVLLDPEVRDLELAIADLAAALELFDSLREGYESTCRMLSREITRRGDLLRFR